MSQDQMTTTVKGFRVEDVTFRHPRKQEEILKETDTDFIESKGDIKAPVSITPEQVKKFCKECISVATDSQSKRVYSQVIKWIDELAVTKKKLIAYEMKEAVQRAKEDSPEDLQE